MTDHFATPVDRERHRLLAGESRVRVLEALRAAPAPLTILELADLVDLHPNTVRMHLAQLVDAGLATGRREARDRPGRPRLVYDAVAATSEEPDAGPDDESSYRLLAEVLVNHVEQTAPEPVAEATAAGRAWGRTLAREPSAPPSAERATADLTGLLDRFGFAPHPTDAGRTIELHRCPFRQVAEQHSPVVCGVHLGLMQGALERNGAPIRTGALEPFVTPELCLARLEPVPTGGDGQAA
ncbi:helix-turn-helix domain-containing protein [Nocardioides sp. LMS-CY]|uniref:helix-turn-helix transcriptional regulator n=1 Tax=Nocardioides sp. (strain LMS-CY) TaxID=2840457 RepID=UPI001C0078BA|nr:helix-turn-helix domain-containing protein [Nocardioides sp. LMS-CY]QWF22658.1 helix-turn-helix domain-containing protein [Nocardioides sp. LMS-CY]